MNDLYQRIHIKSEEADSAQILEMLATLKDSKVYDIKLLNYFKEIPVSYGATVVTVEENSAEFLVNQLQAVVMAEEKVTILKSDSFPRDVLANVTYVNIEKSRIILSRFSYAVARADRRMSVRVELTDPTYASFTSASTQVAGRLNDMSLTGMSISVSEEPTLTPSESGTLTVILPIGIIAVPATLLKVLPQNDAAFRLVFEIEVDRTTEKTISQYIFQRQVEIIRELKDHPGITNS